MTGRHFARIFEFSGDLAIGILSDFGGVISYLPSTLIIVNIKVFGGQVLPLEIAVLYLVLTEGGNRLIGVDKKQP